PRPPAARAARMGGWAEPLEPRQLLSATDLDAGFGTGGRAGGAFGGGGSEFTDVAVLPDGKTLAVGTRAATATDTPYWTDGDFLVARYAADGQLDPTFGGGDGWVTTDFAPGGAGGGGVDSFLDQAAGLAVLPDGRFVVAGLSRDASGNPGDDVVRMAVSRYNADGSPDAAFGGGDGKTAVGVPGDPTLSLNGVAVAATTGGRIVVAGTAYPAAYSYDAAPRFAVARFAADGSLDPTFGTGGVSADPLVTSYSDQVPPAPPAPFYALLTADALAVLPNGKLLVGGTADVAGDYGIDQRSFALARYNADGSLDSTFGDQNFPGYTVGVTGDGDVGGMVVRPDGSVVLAGSRRNAPTGTDSTQAFSVGRYAAAGPLDRAFGNGTSGNGPDGFADLPFDLGRPPEDGPSASAARGVASLPNGQLLAVGVATDEQVFADSYGGTVRRLALARLSATGAPDPAFGSAGQFTTDALSSGEAVVLQRDGKAVVAGWYGTADGVARQAGLARFQPLGTASVAGTFYRDDNGNGARNAGEPPLVGWTAYADANDNGTLDPGEPAAVSGADGTYALTGLAAGAYRVREVRLDAYARTQPAGAYPLGYYDLTLTDGQAAAGKDYGNRLSTDVIPPPTTPPVVPPGTPVPPVVPPTVPPPPPNVAPTAAADVAATPQDVPVEVDVLANDADDDRLDPGSVTVTTAPAHGTAAVNPVTGRVTYAPASGYAGTDAFSYTVADDDEVTSAPAAVAVTIAAATLGGTATSTLPDAAVAGQKSGTASRPARVSVAVANKTGATVAGPVRVQLYLSADGTLDANDAAVAEATKTLKLTAGQAKPLRVRVASYPAVPGGAYRVLAKVTAADGTAAVLAAGALAVATPFVDLTGAVPTPPVAPLAIGGRVAMSVAVGNSGNVPAVGGTAVKVYASADGTLDVAADRLVATVPARLTLKPGKAKSVRVRFALPADLAAGSVTLIAAVDADNAVVERNDGNNTVAVGPFTVG
ncbi:MAG: uncharacterized protein JWO31_1242, partial [Phycisphaerales bacterium]|nr:uncharacterized protein [Phycisphaerales bacterium]